MKQYKRNYSCMHKTKMSLMVSVIVICMLLILALTIPTHAVTHTESQNNLKHMTPPSDTLPYFPSLRFADS